MYDHDELGMFATWPEERGLVGGQESRKSDIQDDDVRSGMLESI